MLMRSISLFNFNFDDIISPRNLKSVTPIDYDIVNFKVVGMKHSAKYEYCASSWYSLFCDGHHNLKC